MNIYTGEWRALQPMLLGRHSGGGAILDGRFHVTAGSLNTGGAPETDTHEALQIDDTTSVDFDSDGLTNTDELRLYGTHPAKPDTDADGIIDSVEIQMGLNPLDADTDGDGVPDGDEEVESEEQPTTQTPVDMSTEEPPEQTAEGTGQDNAGMVTSSGGNVSILLLVALLVGSLSRIRLPLRQIFVEK